MYQHHPHVSPWLSGRPRFTPLHTPYKTWISSPAFSSAECIVAATEPGLVAARRGMNSPRGWATGESGWVGNWGVTHSDSLRVLKRLDIFGFVSIPEMFKTPNLIQFALAQ